MAEITTLPRSTPPTGPGRDQTLLRRYHEDGDRRAREQLIERHMPLARRLARRYSGPGAPSDDLVQVAAIGLIKAIDRFEPERGLALSTFAVPTILGEIKRYLRDTSWSVRVPRDLQEQALRVERLAGSLERSIGRAATVPEVARAAGLSVEEALAALEAATAHSAVSLDAPRRGGVEDEPSTIGDRLGREERGLACAEARADLTPLLARLPERERQVLVLRFGADLTQSEIGERLGISQMHVSRLIRRAIERATAARDVA